MTAQHTAHELALDSLAQLAASAIDCVESAETEADWNIPTFGPTSSEALEAKLEDLHEPLADLFITLSGKRRHASDCATSSAPAYLPRPCDCSAVEQWSDHEIEQACETLERAINAARNSNHHGEECVMKAVAAIALARGETQ